MTYIVAEAGIAHEGKLENAFKLVEVAKYGMADAVKFQVYKTENFVTRSTPQFERYKKKELSYADFKLISDYAKTFGITFFATPHDEESLDFLLDLDVPIIKIGSGELGNWRLLDKAVAFDKRIFISVGMHTDEEIQEVADRIDGADATILHCVTMYPTPPEQVRLKRIPYLKRIFSKIGYSDHTAGFHIPVAATVFGASVIEKHIKLDESTGQDTLVALNDVDFRRMVNQIRDVKKASVGVSVSLEQMKSRAWALKDKTTGKRH